MATTNNVRLYEVSSNVDPTERMKPLQATDSRGIILMESRKTAKFDNVSHLEDWLDVRAINPTGRLIFKRRGRNHASSQQPKRCQCGRRLCCPLHDESSLQDSGPALLHGKHAPLLYRTSSVHANSKFQARMINYFCSVNLHVLRVQHS